MYSRYHYIPIKIAQIKKTDNIKHWWGGKIDGTHIHSFLECKMVQTLWEKGWQCLTNLYLPYNLSITLLVIYPREIFIQETNV